ncbi:MAG TPA: hypothetical protein VHL77_02665 [Ferruginibacter sp.]|jgi:hypothetical protein|nr:hypothetical protein [Ferruginibacter sp.]
MKKHFIYTLPGFIAFLLIMSSCFHVHDHDTSITTTDDEDEYEMEASYGRNKSHAVQVYLNDRFAVHSGRSFRNKNLNDEITLDDNTTVYINSYPGELRIKVNKAENSEESCERIRIICEDLKDILEDN